MLHAEYIAGSAGRLFCVLHLPAQSHGDLQQPAVVVSPAFGDEMNKTRQTVTRIAASLNAFGVAVVVPDVFGTGDSEGEFCDASWLQWCDDFVTAITAASRFNLRVEAVLAVRTGALLAAHALSTSNLDGFSRTVWLQPTWKGSEFLSHLLRVRALGRSVTEGRTETVAELRSRLVSGQTINVAGYQLNQAVAQALGECDLNQLVSPRMGRICAIDVTRRETETSCSRKTVGATQIVQLALRGEPYWNATEIVVNNGVVEHATHALLGRAETCAWGSG